ncbi:MAG: hypothetical protein ABIQ31_08520 [Ferruginibacter sp.]
MNPEILPYDLARLRIPKWIFWIKPWQGWNVVFHPEMTPADISLVKPFIEEVLNKYLEQSVDVESENLVVPFSNKLAATGHPLIYTFKIRVFVKNDWHRKILFQYPSNPVHSVNGYIIHPVYIHLPIPGESRVNTVSLRPPPG